MDRKTALTLIIIVAIGAFFRFWHLNELPPGLYPDEAMNGVNAIHALNNADFEAFYPENNGREGLFINLQVLSVQIFGPTAWSLRATSAAIGTLTVLIFYFLLKEFLSFFKERLTKNNEAFSFFNNEYFVPTATFLLAVNSWHVHFSRIGFRAIMVSFLLSLALLFLLRGMRTKQIKNYILSGFWWGLGFYSYIGFRLSPILGLAVFIFDAVSWRVHRKTESFKTFFSHYIVLGIATVVTMIPLLGYLLSHPQDISSRSSGISVFASTNPILTFLESAAKTALMFNIAGDWNWRHNLAGAPQLTLLVSAVFLIGALILIKNTFLAFKEKNIAGAFPVVFIFGWLFVMLMPAMLTNEGLPHALRSIGAIPPVIILATIGLIWIWDFWRRNLKIKNVKLAAALLILALFAVGIENYNSYFVAWANDPNIRGAFRQDLVLISKFLNDQDENTLKYVVVNENATLLDNIPMPSATIRFLTNEDNTIRYLTSDRLDEIQTESGKKTIIVLTNKDDNELNNKIYDLFPNIQKNSDDFTYYQVNN